MQQTKSCNLQEGFLFKGNKLCIPKAPIQKLLVKKVHGGGMLGNFDINKTIYMLKNTFTCQRSEGTCIKQFPRVVLIAWLRVNSIRVYTTRCLFQNGPCEDVGMDSIVPFHRTQRVKDVWSWPTVSLRWLDPFFVKRMMMLLIWLLFNLRKLSSYMVFPEHCFRSGYQGS